MHLDTVRPQGSWFSAAVPGATDYLRLDRSQAKILNGDVGSTLQSGSGISFTGTPIAEVKSIKILILTTGPRGTATFAYYLNGNLITTATTLPSAPLSDGLNVIGVTLSFANTTFTAGQTAYFLPSTPTTPIYIGGSGLNLSAGTSLVGGVRTERGGSITIGASDLVPQLSPARTRSIFMSMVGVASGSTTNYGDRALVTTPLGAMLTSAGATIHVPSRFLHHGGSSKLLSVVASYTSTSDLLTLIPPGFNFLAQDSSGNITTPTWEPGTATIWLPTTGYTSGQYVRPEIVVQNTVTLAASYFRCLGNGTSGSGPTWNFTPGSVTPDGGTSWVCIGGAGAMTGYAGQLSTARYDLDPLQSATLDIGHRHVIRLGNDIGGGMYAGGGAGSVTIIGFQFNFGNITDMSFY